MVMDLTVLQIMLALAQSDLVFLIEALFMQLHTLEEANILGEIGIMMEKCSKRKTHFMTLLIAENF